MTLWYIASTACLMALIFFACLWQYLQSMTIAVL